MKSPQIIFYSFLIFILTLMGACSTGNDDDDVRFYRFTHAAREINYTFVAKTSNTEVIAKVEQELQKPFDKRNMHINGPIKRGSKEYNSNWSWYFVENEWDIVDVSTEVCDGRPTFVEEELKYWVDDVGRFCPWSSRVEEEVDRSLLLNIN